MVSFYVSSFVVLATWVACLFNGALAAHRSGLARVPRHMHRLRSIKAPLPALIPRKRAAGHRLESAGPPTTDIDITTTTILRSAHAIATLERTAAKFSDKTDPGEAFGHFKELDKALDRWNKTLVEANPKIKALKSLSAQDQKKAVLAFSNFVDFASKRFQFIISKQPALNRYPFVPGLLAFKLKAIKLAFDDFPDKLSRLVSDPASLHRDKFDADFEKLLSKQLDALEEFARTSGNH